jgi:glyoxylase-like metal-dependent hydrolase (beta-lactamase superfamily II)
MSEIAFARSAPPYLSEASVPRAGAGLEPDVTGFYEEATGSVQYVVADPITRRCAIIDPVLDFDPTSGATRTTSADRLLRHIEARGSPWNGSSIPIRMQTTFQLPAISRT